MPNYQLYRTNIKLGGQMKWDIILRSNNNELVVDDFHLTPVSDNTPYNRFTKENLLNHNHLYNIKSYYSKLEGSFYKDYADPNITSLEPLIVDENYGSYKTHSTIIDDHDSTLEYGLRRMSYAVYNNQFSFFCPIWLSYYDPSKDKLEFVLTIYTKKGKEKHTIVKKTIKFENKQDLITHNKFVNYFNEFESSIQSTNSNILKIDLKNKKSYIRGIDVEHGTYVGSKDISNLAKNILHGERLLMDTDALIINNFENNKLIACQLFNFNFVFDIEELIPVNIVSMLYGANITADMQVKYNDKQLEIKDFYSNYDYIPCKSVTPIIHQNIIKGDETSIEENVFNLVYDNKNVDLLDKNKVVQNIIHWSLDGNNDYIFNFYTGFGGYINEGTKENPVIKRSSLNYQDSIDIWTTKADKTSAGWNWLYAEKIQNSQQFAKIYNQPDKYLYPYTTLGGNWLNGIYFNKTTTTKTTEKPEVTKGIRYRCIVLCCDNDLIGTCVKNLGGSENKNIETEYIKTGYIETRYIDKTKSIIDLCIVVQDTKIENDDLEDDSGNQIKYIFILNNSESSLSKNLIFKNFKNLLSESENTDLSKIYKWMNSIEEPSIYTLSPLGYHRADSPSLASKELNHYLMKDVLYSLLRYDGYLQPCFVDITSNNYYTKKIIKSDELSESKYIKYENSGFKKVYPSIGYYPWNYYDIQKSDDEVTRNLNDCDYTETDTSTGGVVNKKYSNYEYRFFGNNQMIILKPNFTYNLYNVIVNDKGYTISGSSDVSYNNVKDLIKLNILYSIYPIPVGDIYSSDYLEYIYNKYDISVDWEYNEENDIQIYNYKINFILK